MNLTFTLLAAQRIQVEEPSLLFGRLLALGSLLIVVFVPILVIRARRRAQRPESIAEFFTGIEGIRWNRIAQPGDVHLTFHTYSGFLVYVTQRTHDLVLPAAEARVVLNRMFKHNLTWGMFACGVLLIPIVSYFEYRSQSRKIDIELQRGFPVMPR
jgi:hypothetical protein